MTSLPITPLPITPLAARRLLAVMPHPDDEAYSAAGTVALATDRGAVAGVLCVTRGEAGGDADVRAAELRSACDAIGAELLPTLGWPDGGVAGLVESSAVTTLRAALLGWRPDVVLGLAGDGAYGHADHLALHRLLRQAVHGLACADTGPSWTPPALYEAVFPRRHFHPVWRSMRRRGFTFVPTGWTPERFGAAPEATDVVVDLSDVAGRKRAAIAAHTSQLGGAAPEDFLRPGLMLPLLQLERWRLMQVP